MKTRIATYLSMFFTIVGLIMMVAPTATAVPASELLRVQQEQSFQGVCCFSWLETVRVIEPAAIVPVIVTWSGDYRATDTFFAGLSVNGGPCDLFGPGVILKFSPFDAGNPNGFSSRYFQSLIVPGDGLVQGANTFTLCGGSIFSPSGTITLGANTLSVRISK